MIQMVDILCGLLIQFKLRDTYTQFSKLHPIFCTIFEYNFANKQTK